MAHAKAQRNADVKVAIIIRLGYLSCLKALDTHITQINITSK